MNNSRADIEKNYNAAIITLSDKGAAGLRKDESGPAIKQMLEKSGFCKVEEELIMADEPEELKTALIRMCDSCGYNLILACRPEILRRKQPWQLLIETYREFRNI